jgi:hypothetical protein
MTRGRTKENDTPLDKWALDFNEIPNKSEIGYQSTWYFDKAKNKNGCWKTVHSSAKGERHPTVKPLKQEKYGGSPVVMVFKTSNRSNSKTKMKIWNNTNIDYINTAPKLPGVPDNAIILKLGVGKGMIEKYKKEYAKDLA